MEGAEHSFFLAGPADHLFDKGEDRIMLDKSRRTFMKRVAAAAAAAGALGMASAAKAKARPGPDTTPVLYRETEEWRRYYDNLR